VSLLFLHLFEDGVFLDLDEAPTLFLTETKPEVLDAFPFLGRARAPDLARIRLSLLIGAGDGAVPGLAGVGRGRRGVAILLSRRRLIREWSLRGRAFAARLLLLLWLLGSLLRVGHGLLALGHGGRGWLVGHLSCGTIDGHGRRRT
jgi:hypothetical protein